MIQAMGTHVNRFELGERFFVADVLATVAVTAVLTIIGAGTHFEGKIVALGVGSCLVNLYLGQGLYAGSKRARSLVAPWAGLQLLIAVISALIGNWAMMLIGAVQCLFATLLFLSRNVRGFLAHRRGETVPETPVLVAEEGPIWASAGSEVVLEDKAKRAVAGLSVLLEVIAWVLFGLAGVDIVGSLYLMFTRGIGWSLVPVGIFTVLLALVLLTTSDDLNYLTSTKGSEAPHLRNTITDAKVLFTLLLIGTLVTLLAVAIGAALA
jgi:hypothetical protein